MRPHERVACRRVCKLWKDLVDDPLRNDARYTAQVEQTTRLLKLSQPETYNIAYSLLVSCRIQKRSRSLAIVSKLVDDLETVRAYFKPTYWAHIYVKRPATPQELANPLPAALVIDADNNVTVPMVTVPEGHAASRISCACRVCQCHRYEGSVNVCKIIDLYCYYNTCRRGFEQLGKKLIEVYTSEWPKKKFLLSNCMAPLLVSTRFGDLYDTGLDPDFDAFPELDFDAMPKMVKKIVSVIWPLEQENAAKRENKPSAGAPRRAQLPYYPARDPLLERLRRLKGDSDDEDDDDSHDNGYEHDLPSSTITARNTTWKQRALSILSLGFINGGNSSRSWSASSIMSLGCLGNTLGPLRCGYRPRPTIAVPTIAPMYQMRATRQTYIPDVAPASANQEDIEQIVYS